MPQATASEGAEGTEISPRWEAALLAFARDQDRRGVAAATKRAYGADLAELAGWATARGSEPADLRYRDLRGFAAALSGRGLAKSSIARKLAAVRSFFDGMLKAGAIESNPAELLPTPKREQRLPRALGRDQVAELLDRIPAHTPLEIRDRAMFEMAYSSGLRAEEIVNLDVSAIDFEGEQIRVFGKGSKERLAPDRRAGAEGASPIPGVQPPRARRASRPAGALPVADGAAPLDLRRPPAAAEVGFGARRGRARVAPRAPSFVRNAPPGGRRRPALDPGAARPRQRLDDSGLHTGGALAAATGVPARASPRVRWLGWLTFPIQLWTHDGDQRQGSRAARALAQLQK